MQLAFDGLRNSHVGQQFTLTLGEATAIHADAMRKTLTDKPQNHKVGAEEVLQNGGDHLQIEPISWDVLLGGDNVNNKQETKKEHEMT
jgi:hypothetical protein